MRKIPHKVLKHVSLQSPFTVYGVNEGTKTVFHIRQSKPTRAYRIMGKFGEATDSYCKNGVVVERSTYNHVKRTNIDRLLAHMQSSHQDKMFE